MSGSAAHDIKEQVKQATNIVDLIGAGLQLRRQGRMYVGLCPWHTDSRPSLQVNPERQSWKCWVCDIGGDVFSYVMQQESVDFRQALEMLAERAGVQLTPGGRKAKPGSPDDKKTLYHAMAWAEEQFHQQLLHGEDAAAAREYVRQRGINEASIQRYRLGYSPNKWQWLLDRARSTPYSPEVLEAVGLVLTSEKQGRKYDRFRGRVLFSIRDTQSRPIGIGGRVLPQLADDKSAKYINSPETRLFTKSENLYGLDVVRDHVVKHEHAIVMEGYTDVVIARQFGIDNVVAVLGTALGPRHVELLKRYAKRVTLVLDGDEAGQRRANEVLELFVASQIEMRIVTLPAGLDPCDFISQNGSEAFRDMVDRAVDALDHHVRAQTVGFDPLVDTQRANQALERILTTISKAPRLQGDTTTAFRLREQQTLSRLVRKFGVDESTLRSRLTALRRKSPKLGVPTANPTKSEKLDSWESELFGLLLQNPDAVSAVIENISSEDLTSAPGRLLLSVYRRLEAEGVLPDYERVLDEFEDPQIKSIIVELDDVRGRMGSGDIDLHLRDLIEAYRRRREKHERSQHLAKLGTGTLNEQEELEQLQKLIESKKHEQ